MEWQLILPEETSLILSAILVIQVAPSVLEARTKNAQGAKKGITSRDREATLGANCKAMANASRSRCQAVQETDRNILSMSEMKGTTIIKTSRVSVGRTATTLSTSWLMPSRRPTNWALRGRKLSLPLSSY